MTKSTPHPLCAQIRELRLAARMSLKDMEVRYGVNAILVGSYERGDRIPPLHKIDALLKLFGYKLIAVPEDEEAVQTDTDMIASLRAIADQLETFSDLPTLPELRSQGDRLRAA